MTNDGREGFSSLFLFIYFFFFVAVVMLELLLAGGCDIERSADPSVSGSFGWNQSRFKGPSSSSSSWVLRVFCVCVGLIMREWRNLPSRWMATQLGEYSLLFSPFQYVTKEVDGRRFPLHREKFSGRAVFFRFDGHTLLYTRMSRETLFDENISRCFSLHFPRIPSIFNGRADERERDGEKMRK